jgi:hypothetical protein
VSLAVDDSDVEDEDTYPQHKIYPKNLPKSSQKKRRAKPTVINSSDDEDRRDGASRKSRAADSDTGVEEIKKPKESPEEEVGELSIIA